MKKIGVFILFVLLSFQMFSQNTLSADSCVADFRHLVRLLEETHPDPYQGFGGKVYFHKKVMAVENELRSQPQTLETFSEHIKQFISNMHDGHTFLYSIRQQNGAPIQYLPLRFRCTTDALVVNLLPEQYSHFLNGRLLEINGHKVDELLDLVAVENSCENQFSRYTALGRLITKPFVQRFSPDVADSVRLLLLMPNNKEEVLTLGFMTRKDEPNVKWEWVQSKSDIPNKHLGYQFIDKKQQVMLFRARSIMARDNIEVELKYKMEGGYNDIKRYYANNQLGEMPKDTLEALAGIPSFSGTFAKMLEEMKAKKAPYLVIDLRGNSGGWTPIVLPTLYQLYGDDYVMKNMEVEFVRLLSPLYLQKVNLTLEQLNKNYNSNFALGDYIIDEESAEGQTVEEARKSFVDDCMSSERELLEKQQGKPLYRPKQVFVITDNLTFSAAFHYAFYLWKMGATVVGVPSGQAPNTFMEVTPFKLPITQLEGSISNSMQMFLPAGDKRSEVFWPDWVMNFDDFKKYDFDSQAEILYLLDRLADMKN